MTKRAQVPDEVVLAAERAEARRAKGRPLARDGGETNHQLMLRVYHKVLPAPTPRPAHPTPIPKARGPWWRLGDAGWAGA